MRLNACIIPIWHRVGSQPSQPSTSIFSHLPWSIHPSIQTRSVEHMETRLHIYAHFNCIIILIKRVSLRKKVVARLNSAITNSVNDSAAIITDSIDAMGWPANALYVWCWFYYGKTASGSYNICDPYWLRMEMEICRDQEATLFVFIYEKSCRSSHIGGSTKTEFK